MQCFSCRCFQVNQIDELSATISLRIAYFKKLTLGTLWKISHPTQRFQAAS